MAGPKLWSYESWDERKQRELTEFDAIAQGGRDSFASPDPIAPTGNAQSATQWGARVSGTQPDRAAETRRQIAARAAERTQGAGSSALGKIGQVLSELDRPLSERLGVEIPDLPGPLDEIGNFALREVSRPTNLIGAAVGGPASLAALRTAGRVGKIAASVASPVLEGGFATRLAGEAAVNAGGRIVSDTAVEALPEDSSDTLKAITAVLAGVAGGVGAAGLTHGARYAYRAGERAAAQQAAALPEDAALARYRATADEVLPDVEEALNFGRLRAEADAPNFMARFGYELLGTKADWLRPGLSMKRNILESNIGADSAKAAHGQIASSTRQPILDAIDTTFGEGATNGGRIDFVFKGPQEQMAYPGIGTIKDIFERPNMYELKPEQSALIDAYHQRNEVERLSAARKGVVIKEFTPGGGGAYLPNIDASESVEQWLKNMEGTTAETRLASTSAKQRDYATGYDRWAHDMQMLAEKKIAPDQVFNPQTNLRILTEGLDAQKANAVGSAVFKAGIGGKTLTEVAEEVAPHLKVTRDGLAKQVQAVRGKLNRALISNRVDETTGKRLQGQLDSIAERARRVDETVAGPEVDLPEIERLYQTVDNIDRSVNEIHGLGNDARAIEFGSLSDDLDELKVAYTEATAYGRGENRVTVPAQRRQINADIDNVRKQLSTLAKADRIDADKARAVRSEGQRILGEMRKTVRPIERGVDRIAREADVAEGFRGRAVDSLFTRLDAMQGRIDDTLSRADLRAQNVDDIRAELGPLKDRLDEARKAYKSGTSNLQKWDYAKVDEVGGLYFPSEEAGQIKRLMSREVNPIAKWIAWFNQTILGGDLSPIVGQQGQVQWLSAPIQTTKDVVSALKEGWEQGDVLRAFRPAEWAAKVAADPQGAAEFAAATGRAVAPGSVPAEFDGGWFRKLPGGMGEKFAKFNDAVYSATLNGQRKLFDETVADLVRTGMPRDKAVAEAGQFVMQFIPTPNAAGAGLSAGHAAALRAPFTSLTFIQRPLQTITDAGEAFAKAVSGNFDSITPRQKLAAKASMRMAGTALGLAASTAAIEALRTGGDPLQAAMAAVNPDPKNSKFLTMTFPGGVSVPLGGPYRALIRAIAPGEVELNGQEEGVWLPFAGAPAYFKNRITPPLKAVFDIAKNEDFYGNKIMGDGFPANILGLTAYAVTSALPITAQAPISAFRKGDSLGTAALDTVGGFLGTNISPRTPASALDDIARQRYGVSFYDAEPAQQAAIKADHGDIWAEAIRRGSTERQLSEAQRAEYRSQQLADDDLLLTGQVTREDWKQERDRRRIELRARLSQIYGDDAVTPEAAARDPMLRFVSAIHQATDPATKRVDWEFVDEQRAGFTDEENAFIDRNTGASDTPLSRLYRDLSTEYYAIPQYVGFDADESRDINTVWQAVRNVATQMAGGQQPNEAIMALAYRKAIPAGSIDPKVAQGVQRRILHTLAESKKREQFRKRTPAAALIAGQGPLTDKDIAAIELALP